MPLPWKKSSRFSRIVADLQSPNNRGSSLVVETGFPTSLVDLFVKNRDKFKKPFKNKKHKRRKHRRLVEEEEDGVEVEVEVEELLISDPVLLSNSRDLGNLFDPVSAGERGTRRPQNLEEPGKSLDGFGLVGDDKAKSCHLDDDNRNGEKKVIEEEEAEECVVDVGKGKSAVVLVLFWKVLMLMLVVLACSTKKLAVGVTMSAFLLMSLEYVAEHVLCFSKPCSNARSVIEPLIQRVVPFIHISRRGVPVTKEVKNREVLEKELIVQGEDDFVADSCDLVGSQIELGSCAEEIQVLESNLDGVAQVEEDEANLDLLRCEKRWGSLDDAVTKMKIGVVGKDKNDVVIGEKQCRPLAKKRSNIIKKLVPKKLRDRKRRKNKESEPHSSSEGGSCWGEDKSELLEEEEIVDRQGLKIAGEQLTEFLVLEGGGDEENDSGKEKEAISHANRGLRGMDEIIPGKELVKKRTNIQRKHNPSYLILFIIVLAGLVRGRILALVLTVASCLMFKIVTRCKRCKQVYE